MYISPAVQRGRWFYVYLATEGCRSGKTEVCIAVMRVTEDVFALASALMARSAQKRGAFWLNS